MATQLDAASEEAVNSCENCEHLPDGANDEMRTDVLTLNNDWSSLSWFSPVRDTSCLSLWCSYWISSPKEMWSYWGNKQQIKVFCLYKQQHRKLCEKESWLVYQRTKHETRQRKYALTELYQIWKQMFGNVIASEVFLRRRHTIELCLADCSDLFFCQSTDSNFHCSIYALFVVSDTAKSTALFCWLCVSTALWTNLRCG